MVYQVKNKIRKLSHTNKVLKKIYSFANRVKVHTLSNVSDRKFAMMKYKENTGEKLNLDNPVTFDDKVWWLKLNNRNPMITKCSDKYLVREYVTECGLGHILNELYGVYKNANDIDFDKLPNSFILKCNHGCGGNIICKDKATFSQEKAIKKLNETLKSNYYLQSREWNYKNIQPRIICEKLFEDTDMNPGGLVDYRFLCFDGVVKCVFVDVDTCAEDGTHRHDARRNVYDKDFNILNVRVTRENFDRGLVKKPTNYDEMRSCAETLSKPFAHCRVDLYNINGKIYFGEITFYHAGGSNKIEPEEWAYKLGSWIDLNSQSIIKGNKDGK
jgi:hypothetical protein